MLGSSSPRLSLADATDLPVVSGLHPLGAGLEEVVMV